MNESACTKEQIDLARIVYIVVSVTRQWKDDVVRSEP